MPSKYDQDHILREDRSERCLTRRVTARKFEPGLFRALDAGLTRGGFYTYFESKSDLCAEALACFFTDPNWKNCWEGVNVDLTAADAGAQIVRAYLSRQHFEDIENSCPMVALPSDVARSGASAKRAFEAVFQGMVDVLERGMSRDSSRDRTTAMGIAALCVGGMVIARSIEDRELADGLRDACMTVALQLGGWEDVSRPYRFLPSARQDSGSGLAP